MSARHQSHEKDPRWTAVDEYAFSRLHPSSKTPSTSALDHALAASEKEGLLDIAVGTLGGHSMIWLANASPNVHVTSVEVDEYHTSVEVDEQHAKVARANVKKAGVADRVDIRLGPGVDVLPQLAKTVKSGKRGKFQLVLIDADKETNWNYVNIALGMCNPGACIIVDNVVRRGRLPQDSDDPGVVGARRVVENVGKDDRLDGIVVQTVGEKSYDGFLVAVVK